MANSPNHSHVDTLNTNPHHLSTDSKNSNSNNVQFLRPPNPKFLSVGGAPTVSSRYSTATHATTIPPTPPPKDRWRNLPPFLEVQPRIEEFQFTIPSPQHPQQQQPQLFSSSSPGAPIPSPLQFPSPPAVVAAMSSPVPSVASTVPTPAPASAPARAMSPGPGPTISPGPGAFVPPAVAVTRPSMSRSNTHTTNASGKGSMKGSVSNAISERRFMTSPTRGFI
ncbi:hypothetical protein FRC20_005539 [Serendipita sp. 405]|nr:hypothetical protein FRC15_005581 [Serendipita sp. 397]KAG8840583.1 hypothetical protein FRC20_005539 [Serendipita sp. 405]